jgi:hypothetical protein
MDLKAKVGPLPVWGWGIAVVGAAAGFFWWRNRSSSAATATDGSTSDTGDTGDDSTGIGYDSNSYGAGYAAGVNANGSQEPLPAPVSASGGGTGGSTGTNAAAAHNRFCAKTKDPSGKLVTACGYGTWVKAKNGSWSWVPGMPPNQGLGGGASGKLKVASSSAPAATPASVSSAMSGLTPAQDSGATPVYAAA